MMTVQQHSPIMIDLLYLFLVVAFFVISGAYANGCETL